MMPPDSCEKEIIEVTACSKLENQNKQIDGHFKKPLKATKSHGSVLP